MDQEQEQENQKNGLMGRDSNQEQSRNEDMIQDELDETEGIIALL